MTPFRSGVVAVVGRPNVGKSTLVNALVGQKVAIVSDKPQTTRRGIHAVWSSEGAQVVLTDTPGYHKPRTLLGARLNELVGDAVSGVDLVLHVVDAAAGVGTGDAFVYQQRVRPTALRSPSCPARSPTRGSAPTSRGRAGPRGDRRGSSPGRSPTSRRPTPSISRAP